MKFSGTITKAAAIGAVLGAVLGAAACANQEVRPETSATKRNFTVELKPSARGGKSELQVRSRAQGYGKGGRKDGYVGFDEGESGFIVMTLKGETPGDRCPDRSGDGEADWVITRVELSASGDAKTEKGEDFGESQPEWLKEAFPDVDLRNGVVYAATRDQASATVVVDNDNAQRGERDIWYRVTAESCANGQPVVTDPMVRNKGK